MNIPLCFSLVYEQFFHLLNYEHCYYIMIKNYYLFQLNIK